MKILYTTLISIFLTMFSISALADKIIIKGEPVTVEKTGGVYVPSTTMTTTDSYYYFNIDNTKRVCYKEDNPALVKINADIFSVRLGNTVEQLHCYTYTPDYFTAQ